MIAEELPAPPLSGVVYTPPALAGAVVGSLRSFGGARWLEPSCGEGVFVRAIRRRGVTAEDIVAIDLNRSIVIPRESARTTFLGVDFLDWSQKYEGKFDCIVGNPPYVRIRELPQNLKVTAAATVQPGGGRVGLRANTWYAFLCASLNLLARGGSLAFVLPAAWDYAEYASYVRQNIGSWFRSVLVFRCLQPLFSEVDEGVIVLVCEGWGDEGSGQLHRFEYGTPEELIAALERPNSVATERVRRISITTAPEPRVRLCDVMTVRIGAVTGDAKFFLLTEMQRRYLRLPVYSCRPVLTKNRHLIGSVLDNKAWSQLRNAGEKIWLFYPSSATLGHASVRRYLELDEENGGGCKKGYKVSNRDPWYRSCLPPTPDAFISGHGQNGPWLALRGMKNLTATNTLYTVRFRKRFSLREMSAWGLSILSSDVYDQWCSRIRKYPAGLRKIEPGDVAELLLTVPVPDEDTERVYRIAVKLLLDGRAAMARKLADQWLAHSLNRAGKSRSVPFLLGREAIPPSD